MNSKYPLYLALYRLSFRPGIDMASELSQNVENPFMWQFIEGTEFIIPLMVNEHSKLFFLPLPSFTNSINLYIVDNIWLVSWLVG